MSQEGRLNLGPVPKISDRPHKVYDVDEAKAKLDRTSRNGYRLKRLYADISGDATSGGRLVADKTTGPRPDEQNPTYDAAMDRRRQVLRRQLPQLSGLIDVADRALAEALRVIRSHDRSHGEQVGETGTWLDETAKAQEQRAAKTSKSGTWRAS